MTRSCESDGARNSLSSGGLFPRAVLALVLAPLLAALAIPAFAQPQITDADGVVGPVGPVDDGLGFEPASSCGSSASRAPAPSS